MSSASSGVQAPAGGVSRLISHDRQADYREELGNLACLVGEAFATELRSLVAAVDPTAFVSDVAALDHPPSGVNVIGRVVTPVSTSWRSPVTRSSTHATR